MTHQHSCPSEFTLERWRFGELAAAPEEQVLLAHVNGCPSCRQRMSELASAPAPVSSSHDLWLRAQATSSAQPKATARVRWAFLRWSAVATSALVLLTIGSQAWRHKSDDVLLKGSAWQLGVIARSRDGVIARMAPGAPAAPGDQLRFEVTTNRPKGSFALIMLDSAGTLSRLSPTHGDTLPIPAGRRVLVDDAVELDGSLGPERIILVGCRETQPLAAIEMAAVRALAQAGGDPRKVDTLGTGCDEESFWITKVAR